MKNESPELKLRRAARNELKGQYVFGARGRSEKPAYVTRSTPVFLIEGDAAPKLVGLPYWKTTIKNGRNFRRTLYTPSTMEIVVGRGWTPTT